MSRENIEKRLVQIRESQRGHFITAGLWSPIAAVGLILSAEPYKGNRVVDLAFGLFCGGITVRNTIQGITKSHTAAALEGVLAYDDLYTLPGTESAVHQALGPDDQSTPEAT
jgi:hypothetical protein